MANYNLTSQQIKDTYEQLVQVSGSALVDGTGSLVDSLDYVTNPTFTTYTSSTATSTSASVADLQTQINSLEAGSGSADWNLITGKPSGLVSSSAQTIANLPSGTISGSSQVDYDNISNVPSGIVSGAAQLPQIGINQTDIASLTAETSSYLTSLPSGVVSSSAQTIANIAGQTIAPSTINVDTANIQSASIGYLQSITGSAKIVGDAYIILNNDTPTQRYAGLVVQDSGSTNNTASFEFDGQTNDWFYEYTDDGGATAEYGAVMFGPGYNTKGSHVYPSNNTILKGTGDHHIVDSNITDDGTSVNVSTPLTASAFKGNLDGNATTATSASYALTASFALNAAGGGGGLVAGTGTDSMRSSDDLTTTPADASGDDSIAIGENAQASADSAIAIGNGASATSAGAVDIGGKFKYDGSDTIRLDSTNLMFNSNGTIGSGRLAINMGIEGGSVNGDYSSVFGATYSNISVGNGCIAGGYNHTISSGTNNAIMGAGESCVINGGSYSAIFGGASNILSGGDTSFILGGYQNQVTAGVRNGVIGGQGAISAHDFSVVIGRESFTSTAAYTTYVANLETSGSITLGSEDVVNVSSGSATGSLIDNLHPAIASGSTAIQHIVTIDQSAYLNISASGNVFDDTLYIISDATSTGIYDGNLNITGNLEVDGYITSSGNLQVDGQLYSPTFAGTIASSTSSIDFDNGNFATLNCASSTFLANPTNLQSGTTYTIIITNGANISGYGTSWKFAGGTEPTLSANTDVLTCVSDGTSLYATALADFS